MTRVKRNFKVYARRVVTCEDADTVIYPWVELGETKAVSEEKAINNVRFKRYGNVSQHLPVSTSGHYELWMDWKAEIYEPRENA